MLLSLGKLFVSFYCNIFCLFLIFVSCFWVIKGVEMGRKQREKKIGRKNEQECEGGRVGGGGSYKELGEGTNVIKRCYLQNISVKKWIDVVYGPSRPSLPHFLWQGCGPAVLWQRSQIQTFARLSLESFIYQVAPRTLNFYFWSQKSESFCAFSLLLLWLSPHFKSLYCFPVKIHHLCKRYYPCPAVEEHRTMATLPGNHIFLGCVLLTLTVFYW